MLKFIDLTDSLLTIGRYGNNPQSIRQIGTSSEHLIGIGEVEASSGAFLITQDGFKSYHIQNAATVSQRVFDIVDTNGPVLVSSSGGFGKPKHFVSVSANGASSWDDHSNNLYDTVCSGFDKRALCDFDSESITAR